MKYRTLGTTNISVSVVAMGCWALAGDFAWGPQDEADSLATVHAALEAGINLFDTAEGYGDGSSETVLGRALAGRRHAAVIATKVSGNHLGRVELQQACERSLQRLGTDYIDLYQVHWPNPAIPLAETWEALEGLRAQGKVRAAGVCNYGVRDLSDLLAVGRCAANQLPYSLLWRAIEYAIAPRCVAEQIGILCYSPLAQGLLTGKFASADAVPEGRARTRHFSSARRLVRHGEPGCEAETFAAIAAVRGICQRIGQPMAAVALAWLLHQPGVTSVLAGARHPAQIAENVAGAALELPAAVMAALDAATAELKRALGTNADMFQSESRIH